VQQSDGWPCMTEAALSIAPVASARSCVYRKPIRDDGMLTSPLPRARISLMQVRPASDVEIDHLARLWYDGWHRTHAPLVPLELTHLRTIESFRERLQATLPNVRAAGPLGAPIGFHVLKGEELRQLFVSPEAHGSGVAAALIADAEARLAERGIETAWLACAVGNNRAARFYEKNGWRLAGTFLNSAETSIGPFSLEAWRYEKRLTLHGTGEE
jgi:GNAT superfamily N-acetyltransferase